MVLTTEELLFINKRVTDTRELVFLLHDKCMKVRESLEKSWRGSEGFLKLIILFGAKILTESAADAQISLFLVFL